MSQPEIETDLEEEVLAEKTPNTEEEKVLKDLRENLQFDIASLTAVLKLLNQALENGDEAKILEVLGAIDQSPSMTSLRNWWDKQHPRVRKLLWAFPTTALLFQELVIFGFLTYDGMTEEKLVRRQERSLTLGKWFVRGAPVICPELRPLIPLFEALIAFEEKKQPLARKSRAYLAQHRQPPEEEVRLAA